MFDANDWSNINRINRILENAERMRTTTFFHRSNSGGSNSAYVRELEQQINDQRNAYAH